VAKRHQCFGEPAAATFSTAVHNTPGTVNITCTATKTKNLICCRK